MAIDCCWKHDSTNSQSGHIYTSLTCIWNIMVIIITRISFSIFAFWVSLSDTYGPPLLAQPSLYFSSCNESWSSIYSASSILNYTFKVRLHASCRSSSSSSHQKQQASAAQLTHTLYALWLHSSSILVYSFTCPIEFLDRSIHIVLHPNPDYGVQYVPPLFLHFDSFIFKSAFLPVYTNSENVESHAGSLILCFTAFLFCFCVLSVHEKSTDVTHTHTQIVHDKTHQQQ